MQIYHLKMICLHMWMQILGANPNTADPVALDCVYLQEHLLVFYSSDLFLLNTWGCNYFFLGEIWEVCFKINGYCSEFFEVLWKHSLLIWFFYLLFSLTCVNLPRFYSIRCLFACGKVAKYIIHLQQVKVGCRGICWHTVGTNLSR